MKTFKRKETIERKSKIETESKERMSETGGQNVRDTETDRNSR